jgi:hypothetical protein
MSSANNSGNATAGNAPAGNSTVGNASSAPASRVPAGNGPRYLETAERNSSYFESQVNSQCAKHALNNVLQEEKIGWYPNLPTLVNKLTKAPADNIMDRNTQLNLWQYCVDLDDLSMESFFTTLEHDAKTQFEAQPKTKQEFINLYKDETNINAKVEAALKKQRDDLLTYYKADLKTQNAKVEKALKKPKQTLAEILSQMKQNSRAAGLYEPACDAYNRDNLSFNDLRKMIEFLNYTTEHELRYGKVVDVTKPEGERYGIAEEKEGYWERMKSKLLRNDTIGAVVNLGAFHYIAVAKFVKNCSKYIIDKDSFIAQSFSYIDSVGNKYECLDINALVTKLKERRTEAIIFIYDKPGAYESVAAIRCRQLNSTDKINGNLFLNSRNFGSKTRKWTIEPNSIENLTRRLSEITMAQPSSGSTVAQPSSGSASTSTNSLYKKFRKAIEGKYGSVDEEILKIVLNEQKHITTVKRFMSWYDHKVNEKALRKLTLGNNNGSGNNGNNNYQLALAISASEASSATPAKQDGGKTRKNSHKKRKSIHITRKA